MINQTRPIDKKFLLPCDIAGKVQKISYPSQDFTIGQEIEKTAYVYLPYGYDVEQDKRYDIFYFMHGWTGNATELFYINNGQIKNLLDHMIATKMIPPMIVVAATFDAENKAQSFSRSVEELEVFHKDFREYLMPYVESHYRTYAKSIMLKDLSATRKHRAFGGFSLGAVTTWYQLIHNLDYIKYYLPMAGDCWQLCMYGGLYQTKQTVDFLEQLLKVQLPVQIMAMVGTEDAVFEQVDRQMKMMQKHPIFSPPTFSYWYKIQGKHDFNAVAEYIYNALPQFFAP